jgi:hypothetical protein
VPILSLAVATMSLAQLLDLGTFVAMVSRVGLGAEANPVVASLVAGYGLPMAVIAKTALMAFVIALTLVLAARRSRLERGIGVVVIAFAIVAGLVGGGSNVIAMGGGMVMAR